jgi:hypothetical protein
MNNLELSGLEVRLIKEIIAGNKEKANKLAEDFGWLNKTEGKLSRNRERLEIEEKLSFLGLSKPWI